MPLDNDTYDVKMPSLEGKAWAGTNGDWVVYIGSNCEWELVNVYTHQRIPLPKISECPEVEHTDDLRTFKYDQPCDISSQSRGKGEESVDCCHSTRRGAPPYVVVRSEIVQKDSLSSH